MEAECQLNTKHHSQTTAAGIFISEEDESRSKICLGQKKKIQTIIQWRHGIMVRLIFDRFSTQLPKKKKPHPAQIKGL